ncbi:MAG: hypothetical protein WCE54_23415 [Ignavibacteriaceae bacterium]
MKIKGSSVEKMFEGCKSCRNLFAIIKSFNNQDSGFAYILATSE